MTAPKPESTRGNIHSKVATAIRPKYAVLTVVLLFCFFQGFAQNEKVIFNLDKGEFTIGSLPYVKPITITGMASKGGIDMDAIRLTVKKNTKKEDTELKAKRYELLQLQDSINKQATQIATLSMDVGTKSNQEISDLLAKDDLGEVARKVMELKDNTDRGPNIQALLTDKKKEISKKKGESEKDKIKLEAEILKLETTVSEIFFDGLWEKSPTDKEFSFAMPDALEMSENYSFVFTLYSRNKTTFPIDSLLNPLVADIDTVLDAHGYYTEKAISGRVETTVEKVELQVFSNVYTLASNKNEIAKKGLNLDGDKIKTLTKDIAKYYTNKSGTKQENKNIKGLTKAMHDLISKKPGITVTKRDQIVSIADQPGKLDELNTALTSEGFSASEVKSITGAYTSIEKSRETITKNETELKGIKANITQVFDYIKNLYVQKGSVSKQSQTGGSASTDLDGIRVSTTYGIGVVSLDNQPLGNQTIEWFRFFGVNIRFADFDNRLPGTKAYKKQFLSRCALMVGISTTSDMQYKGKKLENTRLGFKPVIGFNFEPIKHVNIGFGGISFIQEPIGNSQRDPKIRPYVNLSFDFNLFNYLIQKQ